MSHKRDFEEADDGHIEPEPKRAKTKNSKTRQHQNSGIDPTWGQKYVFSDLEHATTIPQGEESEFEDDSDAMAYLMSVRQQASSIPHLLVAPKIQIGPQLPAGYKTDQETDEEEGEVEEGPYTSSETDSRGYYEDGAYIGLPEDWEEEEDKKKKGGLINEDETENPDKALREAYLASVLDRYHRLRKILHSKPPADATSRLTGSHPTDAPPFGRYSSTTKTWSTLVHDTDPHPLQVALLSKDSVIRILRVILGGKFLRQGYQIPERTSHWLWALLAKLPDQGELNHTEIGWIRDLGRRAVLLGRSLAEMAALRDELAEDGFGVNDNVDASSSDEEVVAEILDEDVEEEEEDDTPDATEDAEATAAPLVVDIPTDDINDEGEVQEAEEGEIDEDGSNSDGGDVAMDIASDSEADEGEVIEKPDEQTALEEAKRGLLAKLAEVEDEQRREVDKQRARMNMRATLNMILTVAGEFYGQRDLLEFREPFVGM
ncbi:hypothetical protein PT974_09452 [Cladobotryum mycophilum]|uniref:V-snare n=1 Tax=Cladobotryum mycophilum TaxID=491253 RepID=A0ABR0SGQ9_9HYPO